MADKVELVHSFVPARPRGHSPRLFGAAPSHCSLVKVHLIVSLFPSSGTLRPLSRTVLSVSVVSSIIARLAFFPLSSGRSSGTVSYGGLCYIQGRRESGSPGVTTACSSAAVPATRAVFGSLTAGQRIAIPRHITGRCSGLALLAAELHSLGGGIIVTSLRNVRLDASDLTRRPSCFLRAS